MARGQSSQCLWGRSVLITAVCPTCKRQYQLQPALLGQTIRCPNASCRRPFVVTNGDAAVAVAADHARHWHATIHRQCRRSRANPAGQRRSTVSPLGTCDSLVAGAAACASAALGEPAQHRAYCSTRAEATAPRPEPPAVVAPRPPRPRRPRLRRCRRVRLRSRWRRWRRSLCRSHPSNRQKRLLKRLVHGNCRPGRGRRRLYVVAWGLRRLPRTEPFRRYASVLLCRRRLVDPGRFTLRSACACWLWSGWE